MNSFLKKIVLFSFLCILISAIISVVYVFKFKVSKNDIPAPPLSDSYSLNEKIEFLRTAKKDLDVIAIGSSITLNNLNSEVVVKRMETVKFLNTASWGINMSDSYSFLKTVYEIYSPKVLIIASSFTGFEMPSIKADYLGTKKYLTASNFDARLYYLTRFNLRYYMDNMKYKKLVQSAKNQYECLVFDQYGGVNIDDKDFEIDQQRWNTYFRIKRIREDNYDYVDSISYYCKSKNIKLLFFQSPLRKGIYTKLSATKLNELQAHVSRIAVILKRDNQVLIDANAVLWNDALFIDSEHFSENGSKAFTTYCFDQLDSMRLFPPFYNHSIKQ